jgi:N4-(beta-N-acetylglucosaminyl)-L-asparaginase
VLLAVIPALVVYLTADSWYRPPAPPPSAPPLLKVTPPFVVNTWAFVGATAAGFRSLQQGGTSTDAVVAGCGYAEQHPDEADYSVGYGGSPSESSETTLDAMIFYGPTRDVGAVGCLRNITTAIAVARAVLEETYHTLLVGDLATMFAVQLGFGPLQTLSTPRSLDQWNNWATVGNHTPNYWKEPHNYSATPPSAYSPCLIPPAVAATAPPPAPAPAARSPPPGSVHDTIGMIALDGAQRLVAGTSTNGLTYKIPGRVGDSPIPGAGGYADNEVGACVCTGNGDVMMRFLPSFHAVLLMSQGVGVSEATRRALASMLPFYPNVTGAMICASLAGDIGAASVGWDGFQVAVASADHPDVRVIDVARFNA